MATYLLLFHFTDHGVGDPHATAALLQQYHDMLPAQHPDLRVVYAPINHLDGMFIIDAPNDHVAAALALRVSRDGVLHARAMRAYSHDEYHQILTGGDDGAAYPTRAEDVVYAFLDAVTQNTSGDPKVYLSPTLQLESMPLLLGIQNVYTDVLLGRPQPARNGDVVRAHLMFDGDVVIRALLLGRENGRLVIKGIGSAKSATEPAGVVDHYLLALLADPAQAEQYLGPALRGQPTPLVLGIQNMYVSFGTAEAGVDSTHTAATVRAVLRFGSGTADRSFTLVKHDQTWLIDRIASAPDAGTSFTGTWALHLAQGNFMLRLTQVGTRISGFHSVIIQGGNKVDTRFPTETPSIEGTVEGNAATVRFTSTWNGHGTAQITLHDDELHWSRRESHGEHLLPENARLRREEPN